MEVIFETSSYYANAVAIIDKKQTEILQFPFGATAEVREYTELSGDTLVGMFTLHISNGIIIFFHKCGFPLQEIELKVFPL